MGTPEGGKVVLVGDIMDEDDLGDSTDEDDLGDSMDEDDLGDSMDEDDLGDSTDEDKFLEILPTYRLHKYYYRELWVFDSQDEGGGSDQDKSLSADPPDTSPMIRDKIKSGLSMISGYFGLLKLVEFWGPVAIDGRLQLSTSGQPFAVNHPHVNLAKYRKHREGYKYNIMDVNYAANKQPMIITAFLGRSTQIRRYNSPVDDEEDSNLTPHSPLTFKPETYVMIPVYCPSQSSSNCIGVFQLHSPHIYISNDLRLMNRALKKAGLGMFHVQNRIPYEIVHGLKPARDQIKDAIKIVCESLNIKLAQVWITNHEDECHVPFSSSLHYVQKKQTLALKLTGYYNYVICDFKEDHDHDLPEYYHLCDMVPLDTGESRIEKTLVDDKSRFFEIVDKFNKIQLQSIEENCVNGIVICLKSIDTCDVCYAFEFIWYSERVISLKDLLLKLKNWLPRFKFASGRELDEESHVIDVQDSLDGEIEKFKIFEGKQVSSSLILEGNKLVVVGDTAPSVVKSKTAPILIRGEHTEPQLGSTKEIAVKNLNALEEVKEPMVVNDIAHLKGKQKTAPKNITQEQIENQFGRTKKEAAQNLNVSLSTLKRKCKEHEIYEWQGRPKPAKREVNQSRYQSDTNEDDRGAILVPSASERNENQLIIKADYSGDMIKFEIPMSDVTLVSIKSEIAERFELTPGTYKLKYSDEDGDPILLASEKDMVYCIRCLNRLHRTVVRLHVLPSL